MYYVLFEFEYLHSITRLQMLVFTCVLSTRLSSLYMHSMAMEDESKQVVVAATSVLHA